MTLHNALHTGSAAHAVLSALDGRLAQAGLLAPASTGVRLGVLYPEVNGFAVTGTSSTSPWQYSVPAATFVTSKGALDGPRIGTNDAPYLVSTTVPPASNSRYDVIYVMQQDFDATISPDGTTAPVIGVVQGTAAASPLIPTIPVGAYQLAHALIASGAIGGTSGAGVTITQDWQWTSLAGVPIPTRTQAERDAITWGTASAPADVNRLDTLTIERNSGSGWRRGAPYAEWFGNVTTAADGSFSGTFPTGLFTANPVVICTVGSGTYMACAAALATSPTAFNGHCGYFSGVGAAIATTNGFTVAIHAVQATATSAVG